MQRLRICFVITEDWYFWSHRRHLAQFLVAMGHEVHLITRLSNHEAGIRRTGITPHTVGLKRSGKNPWTELNVIGRITKTLRHIRPDVVHLVGMKPILYGSIAARAAQVPGIVCAIAGLGWLFTSGGIVKSMVRGVVSNYFRFALAGNQHVHFIVQNAHHAEVLTRRSMANRNQITTVSGAGVDTHRFQTKPEPPGVVRVLTHARMLWDKGIGEVVEAAQRLKSHQPACHFQLVGDPDPANPASITRDQLQAWHDAGIVQWCGRRDEIPELLAASHIACLPSYHEGFPLSLVEALSCGRPVVTTDIPGCRDVVQHGRTGLLVERKNASQLADALARLARDPHLRRKFGQAGRRDVMQRMSSTIVNQQTLDCYLRLLGIPTHLVEKAA